MLRLPGKFPFFSTENLISAHREAKVYFTFGEIMSLLGKTIDSRGKTIFNTVHDYR
jgi:hypothetical protein